ncbi:phage portal protein [Sinorhizobium medicae]|uniref:phage portal protein n=1 Tax=Sinorhizobium medicae TaxID=110321 RepID=UPI0012975BC3|nr:phage portal protein [Sinorhizobium medicae]MQW00881.1 phage portal protein [Sinorhizobium medicae]
MLNWLRKSPALETRDGTLASPDDLMVALWTGAAPGALTLSGPAALKVPAVSAAVRVISEAAASLDVSVVEAVGGGNEEARPDHPVSRLLRGDANPWTSGFELIRDLVADALTRNEGGLAWINWVGGDVREVIRYQASALSVAYDPVTREPTYRLNGGVISAQNVVHVRSPFESCPVTLAAKAIGVLAVMETHAGKLFQNGARPAGVIEMQKGLGDEGLKKMKAAWKASHEGAENAGKTAILWDGATFKTLTMNSTDAQFLELRTFQVLEVARAFRVPPSMLFELERATWSNSEQMGREFLTYTLEPWLKTLEGALGRALLTREERKRFRIVFDRDDLTRADLGERASAYSSLISSRVINPNQARKWEGLPPYDGGEEYVNPNISAAKTDGESTGETDE